MTATQQFIEDAIKGGWKKDGEYLIIPCDIAPAVATFSFDGIDFKITKEQALLDPLAWQAVGKVRSWSLTFDGNLPDIADEHRYKMHRFIDHLADGKSIEDALAALE